MMGRYQLKLEIGTKNLILSNVKMPAAYTSWWFTPEEAVALRDALTHALKLLAEPDIRVWDIPPDAHP